MVDILKYIDKEKDEEFYNTIKNSIDLTYNEKAALIIGSEQCSIEEKIVDLRSILNKLDKEFMRHSYSWIKDYDYRVFVYEMITSYETVLDMTCAKYYPINGDGAIAYSVTGYSPCDVRQFDKKMLNLTPMLRYIKSLDHSLIRFIIHREILDYNGNGDSFVDMNIYCKRRDTYNTLMIYNVEKPTSIGSYVLSSIYNVIRMYRI